ncbi:MAG: hypothetical protein IJF65_05700 [Clostridia bacterium]|nr:hypothetical protein [Clostridia bacterium]
MSENKQRKHTWLWDILVIAGGLLSVSGLLLVLRKIGMVALGLLFAGLLAAGESYDLLLTSTSPSGEYVLEALRENTPAIEPYYVKVNLLEDGGKQTIYYVRGQSEAEIIWLSDTVAQINGVPVDVTSGECFKANARGYFDVMVQVKAKDVQWLEITVCMDKEPRVTRSRTSMPLVDPADAWGLSPRLNVLKELHWDDDLSKKKAGLTVKLRTANGQEITLPYLWEWRAKEYGSYDFTLTGSAAWGYTLTPDDVECSVTRMADAHE